MLVAAPSVKDIPGRKEPNALRAGPVASVHIDKPVEDNEYFRSVVDVPLIRLIGPVQPDGRIFDPLDIDGRPRPLAGETARLYDAHGKGSSDVVP